MPELPLDVLSEKRETQVPHTPAVHPTSHHRAHATPQPAALLGAHLLPPLPPPPMSPPHFPRPRTPPLIRKAPSRAAGGDRSEAHRVPAEAPGDPAHPQRLCLGRTRRAAGRRLRLRSQPLCRREGRRSRSLSWAPRHMLALSGRAAAGAGTQNPFGQKSTCRDRKRCGAAALRWPSLPPLHSRRRLHRANPREVPLDAFVGMCGSEWESGVERVWVGALEALPARRLCAGDPR